MAFSILSVLSCLSHFSIFDTLLTSHGHFSVEVEKKILTSFVPIRIYRNFGCGGKTRTYDIRATTGDLFYIYLFYLFSPFPYFLKFLTSLEFKIFINFISLENQLLRSSVFSLISFVSISFFCSDLYHFFPSANFGFCLFFFL